MKQPHQNDWRRPKHDLACHASKCDRKLITERDGEGEWMGRGNIKKKATLKYETRGVDFFQDPSFSRTYKFEMLLQLPFPL